jgi:hypothetical protein
MITIAYAFACGIAFVTGAFVAAIACAIMIRKDNAKKNDELAQHYAETVRALEAKADASKQIAAAIRDMSQVIVRAGK